MTKSRILRNFEGLFCLILTPNYARLFGSPVSQFFFSCFFFKSKDNSYFKIPTSYIYFYKRTQQEPLQRLIKRKKEPLQRIIPRAHVSDNKSLVTEGEG